MIRAFAVFATFLGLLSGIEMFWTDSGIGIYTSNSSKFGVEDMTLIPISDRYFKARFGF